MQATIQLENPVVYKLRCLTWWDSYIAYLTNTESGLRIMLARVDPNSLQLIQPKSFPCDEQIVNELKFISYGKQVFLAVVFESQVKFYGLDGVVTGRYQDQTKKLEPQLNQDWLTSVAVFQEQHGKEEIVLATRGGRFLSNKGNTFDFELRANTKRNMSAIVPIGSNLVVGEENGRLLRLTTFEEGFDKQLNLSPNKLPLYVLQKHSNTQVLVGTCQGQLLLVDVVNMSVVIRMYAHTALVNSISRLNDFIITTSEDGHINKFKITEGGLIPFAPSKLNRLVEGILVVSSRPFIVCYQCSTLKELQ